MTRDRKILSPVTCHLSPFEVANPCKPMLGKPTVATVPPNFTPRLAATGTCGASSPLFLKLFSLGDHLGQRQAQAISDTLRNIEAWVAERPFNHPDIYGMNIGLFC